MAADEKAFNHFDADGNAVMVDVGAKQQTERSATASGRVSMSREAYTLVKSGSMAKGDVLGVARVAGIMAAKKVDSLIPMTHPLMITKSTVDFVFHDEECTIEVHATVGITGKTGVEMEALTAVSVSALTIYDMCKAVDKSITIGDIKLLHKSGGKSGEYVRNA
ncbi:MAG: cyclic pyranopterin monophosphate synthase MoaC [Desulfopila sp.]